MWPLGDWISKTSRKYPFCLHGLTQVMYILLCSKHNVSLLYFAAMWSTMTFPTTLRTMFTVWGGLDEQGRPPLITSPAVPDCCVLSHLPTLCCRKTGKALTFITRENWKWARELCNILAQAEQVQVKLEFKTFLGIICKNRLLF